MIFFPRNKKFVYFAIYWYFYILIMYNLCRHVAFSNTQNFPNFEINFLIDKSTKSEKKNYVKEKSEKKAKRKKKKKRKKEQASSSHTWGWSPCCSLLVFRVCSHCFSSSLYIFLFNHVYVCFYIKLRFFYYVLVLSTFILGRPGKAGITGITIIYIYNYILLSCMWCIDVLL